MVDFRKGLLPLFAAGGAAAMLSPDEAEASVYSKDGRRLLDLLNKAAVGELSADEPVFEFLEELPKEIFEAAKKDNAAFKTPKLAATRDNIQHYWNSRHTQMSNQKIEDRVETLTSGDGRFYVRANMPYPESIAVLGENTGTRGSLYPSEEFTCLHQVNPVNKKRLLTMKSRTWGTPDGSAFHPVANETSPLWERPTQRAISADGVPDDFTLSETAMPRKGAPFFSTGGVVLFCASPLSGERWQSGSGPFCRRGENLPFRRVPRLEKGVGMKC